MYRYKLRGRPSKPEVWLSGPDPQTHDQYYVFLQQRNQARFRKEGWPDTFDFTTWKTMWDKSGEYNNRGRKPEQYCMTRIDPEKDWEESNVQIITRAQHFVELQKRNTLIRRQRKVIKNAKNQTK